jgi:hypothetical protein
MTTKTLSTSKNLSNLSLLSIKNRAITALIGWVPAPGGTVIRQLIYSSIFPSIDRSAKIAQDVHFQNIELVEIGGQTTVCKGVEFFVHPGNRIKIDNHVYIDRDVRFVISDRNSKIELADRITIQPNACFTVAKGGCLEVGENTHIGFASCINKKKEKLNNAHKRLSRRFTS